MASIDRFTVGSWEGVITPSTLQSAILPPAAGFNGVAYVRGGKQAPVSTITTGADTDASRASAVSLCQSYRSLSGTAVSVVDSVGELWTNVFVLSVTCRVAYNLATAKWRVVASWNLHPQTGSIL